MVIDLKFCSVLIKKKYPQNTIIFETFEWKTSKGLRVLWVRGCLSILHHQPLPVCQAGKSSHCGFEELFFRGFPARQLDSTKGTTMTFSFSPAPMSIRQYCPFPQSLMLLMTLSHTTCHQEGRNMSDHQLSPASQLSSHGCRSGEVTWRAKAEQNKIRTKV